MIGKGKLAAILLVALLVSVSLGAEGKKEGGEQLAAAAKKEGTIDLWHEWGSGKNLENLTMVNDLFLKKNPGLKLDARAISGDRFEVQRQVGVALMGGNPPEMFNLIPGYQIKQFADAGRLEPITDVWNEINGDKIFRKGIISTVKFDGEAWGIPMAIWALNAVWYNKEVFNRYNLTPPKTWDEMRQVIKVLGDNGVAPFTGSVGGAWCLYAFHPFLVSTLGAEGYMAWSSGQISLKDLKVQEAFRLYKEIWIDNLIQDWSGYSWTDATQPLVEGKAAMFLGMGSWVAAQLALNLKPLEQFDFFFAPGTQNMLIGHGDVMVMVKGGDAPNGAKKYLAHLASVEAQRAWTDGQAIAQNLEVPGTHYGPIESKIAEHLRKPDTVFLPNSLFLYTPDFYTAIRKEMERYAINPTPKVLEEVSTTLENIRTTDFFGGKWKKWAW